MNALFYNIKDN